MTKRIPQLLLLAAATLPAQTVITLDGASGNELYATNYNLASGSTVFGLAFQAEYLVVGGGGGGGGSANDSTAWGGGGGGAGGMLTGTLNLLATSTSVTVGAGGAGGAMSGTQTLQMGANGGSSLLGDVTALGGGGGGRYKIQGATGGSGGGGGGRGNGNNLRTAGGAGTSGQGNAGGASRDDDASGRSGGGGGGGAGGAGGSGGTDVSNAGNGGAGLESSITGTSRFYAAGGGGGAWDIHTTGEQAGTGGSSIGGNGSIGGNASAGAANTGSGGGGVGSNGAGGSGGSGIVIVRYKGSSAGTGGTVSTGTGSADGYTVHTFSTVGSTALDLTGLDMSARLRATLSGQFSGSGTLVFNNNTTVTGPSHFTITGDSSSTHTGIVRVNSGATVQVGDGATSGRLGTGDLYINQGGTLVFDRSDDVAVANTLRTSESNGNNAGTIVKRGAGKLTLTGNGANHAGLLKVEQGTLAYDQTTRFGTATVRAEVAAGATLNLVDNNPIFSGSGYSSMQLETSGAGQFIFSGTARRMLSVAVPGNQWISHTSSLAHTGGTVIDGAGLMLGSGQALAAGSDLEVRGSGSVMSYTSLALGSVVVESGSLYLGTHGLSADALEVRAGSMTASLSSTTDLLKTGSGTFAFDTRASNRSSATRVEGGVLQVSSGTALGTGEVTLAGGTLRIAAGSQFNPVTAQVSTLVLDGGAVDTTVAAASRLAATTLDLRSGTVALRLSGTGSLSKTTAGTVLLSGDNSAYTGAVTVSDGVLQLGTSTGLGSASVVLEGGTIELSGSTIVGYFEQTGGTVTGGTLISSQILTESGTLDSVIADGVTVINFSPRTINAGILKRTAGVTEVTAANTFTGVVNVQAGTLRLAGEGAFASASSLATRQGGTLDLNGKSQTLRGIGGDGAITLGTGGALTVSSVSDSTFDGTLSGAGTLTKSGAGTLTLTGTASHTGATSVSGGKLVVNGTLGSGDLMVAYGSVLGGSGTINGDTTISGIHAPGNSPGVQTFGGNLSYANGSSIAWELGDNTESNSPVVMFDQVVVAGDLNLAGMVGLQLVFDWSASTVDWSDTFWLSNRSWQIFDVGGTTNGLSNVSLGTQDWLDAQGDSFNTVLGGSFSLSQTGSDVFLNYSAIPEPSTYGLILGGLVLAGAALRRQKKKTS